MNPAHSRWARLRVRPPLVAVMLVALAWTVLYTLRIEQYFVQPDELEYVRQAIQIGADLHPIFPGDRIFVSWSQLQPILMAPAWTLLPANTAFAVQHVVNSVVMVSAAIPAYLLAKRVTGEQWAAYVTAALTVTVPWLTMPATMMTEVAAYPAFLWAVLGLQFAVAQPSARHDLIGLAAIGLALSARPQFLVLAPAFAGAAVLQTLRFPPVRDWRVGGGRLRAALASHPVLLAAALLGAAGLALGGHDLRSKLLGSYGSASYGSVVPPGTFDFGREALAYVAVGIGILPLALTLGWLIGSLVRPLNRERHAFAVLLALVGAGMVFAVGSFSVRHAGGVNSRYLFYLAPLMFVGMLALLTERRRMTVAVVAGALLGVWLVHDAELALRGPSLVSPESAFHDVLFGRVGQLEQRLSLRDFPPTRVLAALSLAALASFVLLRRRGRERFAAVAVTAVVALWCVAETGYAVQRIVKTQQGISPEFVAGRSWIDETLPDGATAPMLISSFGDPPSATAVWWDTAFWNKQVGRTLQDARGTDFEQPFPELFGITHDGVVFDPDHSGGVQPGWGSDTPYLVRATTDRRYGIHGVRVLDERNGVQLIEVPRPARLDWDLSAPVDTGLVPAGSAAQLTVFARSNDAPERQRVRITFLATPGGDQPGRLRVTGRGVDAGAIAPVERPAELEVTVNVPAGGSAVLTLQALATPPGGVKVENVETAVR